MACEKIFGCVKTIFCSHCCWSPCRERDEEDDEIEMPIRPRAYYRRWQLPPPEVIRDHVPHYLRQPGPPESREPGIHSMRDAAQDTRRTRRVHSRQHRGLSDGEASRGTSSSRSRSSRREDPRRHTLGSGNQHLYVNPHHPGPHGHEICQHPYLH